MKKTIVLIFILLSFTSFSNEKENQQAIMKIYMLDKVKKIAVLRYPLGLVLKRTSHFEMTPSLGEACQASLIKNTKSFALFDMSNCMQMYDLNINQKLKVISKRYFNLEKTVLKKLEKKEEIQRIFEQEELWLNMVKKEESLKINNNHLSTDFSISNFSTQKVRPLQKKYNLERWYMGISVSRATTTFEGQIQDDLDALELKYGATQTSFSIDSGLYKPMADGRSLYGASIFYLLDYRNGGNESTDANTEVNSIQTVSSQVLFAVSYIKFLGQKRTGHGLFFRGDLGISLYESSSNQDLTVSNLDTVVTTAYNYSPRVGYLIGGGYAFDWDDGKSLLFEINYLKTAATLTSKSTVETISGVDVETEENIGESVSASNILFKIGLFF